MKWTDNMRSARQEYSYHRSTSRDELFRIRLNQQRMNAALRNMLAQQREYERELKMLLKLGRSDNSQEIAELLKKISQLKSEQRKIRLQQHMDMAHDEVNFYRYYRRLRFSRVFFMFFSLLLFTLLFSFGGLGTGLKITVLLFALLTTFGSVFEFFFIMRIKERILDPVDKLKKGVSEITQGHYDIEIEDEAPNEVSSLIRAFNEMALRLKRGEALKAEYEENRKALVANISHDLKTPITSIQGYVEALESSGMPQEKLEKYLSIIRSNAQYMNRLIDDLFLFSMLDMQKLDFHFETVKFGPFSMDMFEEFKLELQEKGIELSYESTVPEEVSVKLDTRRFYQVVRNIVGNAEKHADNGNLRISVVVVADQSGVRLSIADNGPGIPEQARERIFERFYRADPERTKDLNSTGLGLAIANELVEAHGGTISVASKSGEGCAFVITLPIYTEEGGDKA